MTTYKASGTMISDGFATTTPSGHLDWISIDRTNNTAYILVSARASGSTYVTNWFNAATGTIADGVVSTDMTNYQLWGSVFQWKADLFADTAAANTPDLNSVSLEYAQYSSGWTGLQPSGTIISNVFSTDLASGHLDWVTVNRSNNSLYTAVSVRSSGSSFASQWYTIASGNNITSSDMTNIAIWGPNFQWKADLFSDPSLQNTPTLNSVSLNFTAVSSGSTTQSTLGEHGGAWSIVYSA